jgi:ATP-dependent RNA helicase DHX57
MSATADAQLFADYMTQRLSAVATRVSNARSCGSGDRQLLASFLSVGQLTIPGFTYPVREFYLEDAFEMTGYTVGSTSRCVTQQHHGVLYLVLASVSDLDLLLFR